MKQVEIKKIGMRHPSGHEAVIAHVKQDDSTDGEYRLPFGVVCTCWNTAKAKARKIFAKADYRSYGRAA